MGVKINHNRLRPVEDMDLFDEKLVVRFPKDEYRKRQNFIKEYETCQVCEESQDLDTPHHARQGLGVKDDRFLINVCINCHGKIHSIGYGAVKKTREDCESIGWGNHLEFMEENQTEDIR